MSSKIDCRECMGTGGIERLSNCKHCAGTGKIDAPVVERQPVAWAMQHGLDRISRSEHASHATYGHPGQPGWDIPLFTAPPELAELQATIERQGQCISGLSDELIEARAEIEWMKGGQVEPACTSCDGSGKYIDGSGELRGYCVCPAADALILKEPIYQLRKLASGAGWRDADKEAFECVERDPDYSRRILYASPATLALPDRKAGDYLYSHAWNACLDKVKEMNQ